MTLPPAPRRAGRRPGGHDTKGVILDAARVVFSERGYDGTTIRQVAAGAGVDPALVHHYFGTKEGLFRAVMAVPFAPEVLLRRVFDGDVDGVPERLVRTFLAVWADPVSGPAFAGVLRSAVGNPGTAALFREFFRASIVRRVGDHLAGAVDPDELPDRATLVASQLLGLALVRYVLAFEPLAGLDDEAVVAAVAPNVRRYLFGDIGLPAPRAAESSRRGSSKSRGARST